MSRWSQEVPPRKRRRAIALAVGVPMALALPLAAALRFEPGSALAPLFGPWAGGLYGHSDCTMAHAAPTASSALVGTAVVLALLLWRARRRGSLTLLAGLAAIWSLGWSAAALLSVLNSTS